MEQPVRKYELPAALAKTEKILFKRLYQVSMRYVDSRTIEELRVFGIPSLGDAKVDTYIENDDFHTYKKIPELMELYQSGINFTFMNPKNTKEIYEIIVEYIQGWKDYMSGSMNAAHPDVEFLTSLDRFAGKVFPHAAAFIPKHVVVDDFFSKFDANLTAQTLIDLTAQKKDATEMTEEAEEQKRIANLRKHTSSEDYFISNTRVLKW